MDGVFMRRVVDGKGQGRCAGRDPWVNWPEWPVRLSRPPVYYPWTVYLCDWVEMYRSLRAPPASAVFYFDMKRPLAGEAVLLSGYCLVCKLINDAEVLDNVRMRKEYKYHFDDIYLENF